VLDGVREALKSNDDSPSEHWSIDHRRHAQGCAPEHRLAIKGLAPAVVHVQLFQEHVWWIKFPRVGLTKEPPGHYGIDLVNGKEFRWEAVEG